MSLTLGLQTGHEASAALFDGTRLIAAISDERITRIKNDGGKLSDVAVDALLRYADINREEIKRLALLYTFFPESYFIRESWTKELERRYVRARREKSGEPCPQMLLTNFLQRLKHKGKKFTDHFRQDRFVSQEGFSSSAATNFYDHHDSHALPAAFYSGFQECAVVTMDGVGDWGIHHTSGIWRNGNYERTHVSDALGASAGMFYSHVTKLLGFVPMRHEGKVVGLAALGKPEPLYGAFSEALKLSSDGFTLTSSFAGKSSPEEARLSFLKQQIVGHSREDISAAVQQVLEDVVVGLVEKFLQNTGLKKIALNGGVFANVKLNQRIAALPEVEAMFVFPAMSDTGNSVGAVLLDLVAQNPEALKDNAPMEHVYLGPEYSDTKIAEALKTAGIHARKLDESELVSSAASAIHAGRVVGWFQGRMEFGPRALGNRSMLAAPTEKEINDWLNQRLDRSEFMPFAPSVLAEFADDIFIDVDKARHAAEFMTTTFNVNDQWKGRIPAVVHVDGTARPQLVRSDRNPLYHKLISEYHRLSGIPLVLNTSFNVHEEPIVCAPQEAIRAFSEKRVDCLGIGSFWLEHRA